MAGADRQRRPTGRLARDDAGGRLAARRARPPRGHGRRRAPPRAAWIRTVHRVTATGAPVEHRQRLIATDGAVRVEDRVVIDRRIRDLPRVGVGFALPTSFDGIEWLGLGPGDSYPDRRAAARFGRWTATVSDQTLPFVVPQEYGLHLDTVWVEMRSTELALRIHGDRPLAFSAWPTRCPSSPGRGTPTSCRRRPPPTSTSTSPTAASARRRAGPTPIPATWCRAAPTASLGPSRPVFWARLTPVSGTDRAQTAIVGPRST